MHPIKIHPDWIRQYGAHTASVLGFLVQRHATGADEEGWFTAPQRLLTEATGIRPETYKRARSRLEEDGVLETHPTRSADKGTNVTHVNKYRLNLEALT